MMSTPSVSIEVQAPERDCANTVSEALETRRSIRSFDPDHVLPPDEVQWLFDRAALTPSAFNIQNCRFILIRDPALREKARELSHNQAQVTDASLLVALCMDKGAWANRPERYWRHAPASVREKMVTTIRHFYGGRDSVQRDEGIRSCSLAAMGLMLLARQLGYDSCPMVGFDPDGLAKLIRLPRDHEVCMLLAIGKALYPPHPRSGQLSLDEVLFVDGFGVNKRN